MARRGRRAGRGSRSGIVWYRNEIPDETAGMIVKLVAYGNAYMSYQAGQIESYMKEFAPWTDQTGNARQGLAARSGSQERPARTRDAGGRFLKAGTTFYIDLFHQVPYGIWLEIRHAGRFAIIVPTIPVKGDEVIAGFADVMDKL